MPPTWQVQRALLAQMYAAALEAFRVQQAIAFARVIPTPKEGHGDAYYTPRFRETRLGDARHALKSRDRGEYLADLRACQFRKGYLQVLNDTVTGLDELPLFKTLAKREALIGLIRSRLLEDRDVLGRAAKQAGGRQLCLRGLPRAYPDPLRPAVLPLHGLHHCLF